MRPRPRPGLENIAVGEHRAGADLYGSGHRRAGSDSAYLADLLPGQLATSDFTDVLGRRERAERGNATGRFLLQRLVRAQQRQLAAGSGEPSRRDEQLLGDAVPTKSQNHGRKPDGVVGRLVLSNRLHLD
ncbi:hypothetical protein D3C81_1706230 [compost metagenome]